MATRAKVCVVCSRKATRNSLSENDIREIVTFVDKYYDKNDPAYPTGLCNGCHLLLNKKRNGHDVIIPINQTYKSSKSMRYSAALIEDIAHSDVNRIMASKKRRGRPPSQAKQEKSIKANHLLYITQI